MSDNIKNNQTVDNVSKPNENENPALNVKSQQMPIKWEYSQKYPEKRKTKTKTKFQLISIREIDWDFLFGGDSMSATMGAALKKIAVALLTDKKVIKTIGGIVLGIIIIVVMPIMLLFPFLTAVWILTQTSSISPYKKISQLSRWKTYSLSTTQ